MQWQHQCQYPGGCSNIGAHSCSTCGILVCGKHAQLSACQVECANCLQARLRREQEQRNFESIARSKSQKGWHEEGYRLFNAKEYAKAVDAYSYAIFQNGMSYDDNWALAFIMRGQAYAKLEEYEKAAADLSHGITFLSKKHLSYKWCFDCGLSYFLIEKYDRALTYFDQCITMSPRFSRTYYMRGLTYFRCQEYRKALSDLDLAIKLEPTLQKAKDLREKVRHKLYQ